MDKLSLNRYYAELLKGHKIMKGILNLSKESMIDAKVKKMALQIVRNVTGKGALNTKTQSSYIPTALADSALDLTNTE
jgi:hypothetical protein